jgi:hypothetical protein
VLWLAGLGVSLVLAAMLSTLASDAPDGLERVAEDEGFAATAERHALERSPLAEYQVDGVEGDGWSVGLAGTVGVAGTLGVAGALLWLLRRRPPTATPAADDAPAPPG